MEISRNYIADQVFDFILKQISNGVWKPGEKIPSEVDLAQRLNISRMSLRSGVQKANLFGITETRVGEGTFVKDLTMLPFLETIRKSNLLDISPNSINQLREVLQIGSVRIAAKLDNIDSDIAELEKIYEQMVAVMDADNLEPFHVLDAKFHRAICRLCHNDLLYLIYDSLESMLVDVTRQNALDSIHYNHGNTKDLLDYHRDLLKSIKARDIDRFILLMDMSSERHKRYELMKKIEKTNKEKTSLVENNNL